MRKTKDENKNINLLMSNDSVNRYNALYREYCSHQFVGVFPSVRWRILRCMSFISTAHTSVYLVHPHTRKENTIRFVDRLIEFSKFLIPLIELPLVEVLDIVIGLVSSVKGPKTMNHFLFSKQQHLKY